MLANHDLAFEELTRQIIIAIMEILVWLQKLDGVPVWPSYKNRDIWEDFDVVVRIIT